VRVAPRELVRDAVERVVLSGHVGKSGAGLERVRLADGRTLVVKRIEPRTDFTVEVTGGMPGREYLLWRSGVLERLPAGVEHAMVDAWVEDGIPRAWVGGCLYAAIALVLCVVAGMADPLSPRRPQ